MFLSLLIISLNCVSKPEKQNTSCSVSEMAELMSQLLQKFFFCFHYIVLIYWISYKTVASPKDSPVPELPTASPVTGGDGRATSSEISCSVSVTGHLTGLLNCIPAQSHPLHPSLVCFPNLVLLPFCFVSESTQQKAAYRLPDSVTLKQDC